VATIKNPIIPTEAANVRFDKLHINFRWIGRKRSDGYALFWDGKHLVSAHTYMLARKLGEAPAGTCGEHTCEEIHSKEPGGTPTSYRDCVDPEHLKLGTDKTNVERRGSLGRSATGDRNGSRLYPERLAPLCGDQNGSRRHPERLARGKEHSATMLECAARGERHGSRTKPESRARGDRNGSRTKPECLLRGDVHKQAKLTSEKVVQIRQRRTGGESLGSLSRAFGVSSRTIKRVCSGETWAHIAEGLLS